MASLPGKPIKHANESPQETRWLTIAETEMPEWRESPSRIRLTGRDT